MSGSRKLNEERQLFELENNDDVSQLFKKLSERITEWREADFDEKEADGTLVKRIDTSSNPISHFEEQIQAMKYLQGMLLIIQNTSLPEKAKNLFLKVNNLWKEYLEQARNGNDQARYTKKLANAFAHTLTVEFYYGGEQAVMEFLVPGEEYENIDKGHQQLVMARDLAIMMQKHPAVKTISENKEVTTEETSTLLTISNYEQLNDEQWQKKAFDKAGLIDDENSWLKNFFDDKKNIDAMKQSGTPVPPSARWLPLAANLQEVTNVTKEKNGDVINQTSFIRMGTIVPFDIKKTLLDRVKGLFTPKKHFKDYAKSQLKTAIQLKLKSALEEYKKFYGDIKGTKFYVNYQSLLTPHTGETKLPHADNNADFVTMAKECLQEVVDEIKEQHETDYLVKIIACQTNASVNKWSVLPSATSYDEDEKSRRQKVSELYNYLLNKGMENKNKRERKLPSDMSENTFSMHIFEVLKRYENDNGQIKPEQKNEITRRLFAAYHLDRLLDNKPPYDKFSNYQRNIMMAALEFHTMGKQSLTLVGCKSARDRTAVFAAAVKAMQEDPASMGDWQKLNDGIVRSLQQGHHIRSMGYHIASMKLSDVHSNWTSQLKEIASRAKLLNPFTKKLSYEEKIKKNNLFVGHQDKTFIFDLQKKPLNEIEISSDLNGLKKRGFILQHADQIIEWNKPRQNIEVTKYDDATNEWMQKIKESQLNEENSEKTSYYLIQNVKNLIEQTPWKVTMGGVSVQGINVKLPTNVARMYKLCLKADITGNEIGNMSLYNEITQLGKLAQKAHTFDFFGLRKRDQATQDFYDLFTQAPVEKKLEKEEKPIINPMKREQ